MLRNWLLFVAVFSFGMMAALGNFFGALHSGQFAAFQNENAIV